MTIRPQKYFHKLSSTLLGITHSATGLLLMTFLLALTLNTFLFSSVAMAWGRQGHSLIGETAARVVAESQDFDLLLSRAYDVGYYSNVPDMIWKRTDAIHQLERHNHYMDIDIFVNSILGDAKDDTQGDANEQSLDLALLLKEFKLDRLTFNKKYPQIDSKAGRSFWRIREFETRLTAITEKLKALDHSVIENGRAKNMTGKYGADFAKATPATLKDNEDLKIRKHQLQREWLQVIGYISHYVGDLGQPLHVTSNHDGQHTNQPGIHSYYEDAVVDVLTPELRVDVLEKAQKRWPSYHKRHAQLATLEVLMKLTQSSIDEIEKLLAIDRKHGREDILKVREKYKKQITERMVDSSLALAEIISRQLGWQANTDRFYLFEPEPDYVDYPR
jgi:hypothetical protein